MEKTEKDITKSLEFSHLDNSEFINENLIPSELFKLVFENIPIGIGIADLNGNIIYFNEAILNPGNYSTEDIKIIRNVGMLYYDTNDRDNILKRFREFGIIKDEVVRFKRKDGSPYFTLMSLKPFSIDNKNYILSTVEDIDKRIKTESALIESEKSYKELFDNSSELIFIQDSEGNYVDVNKAVLVQFGFSKEEILGKPHNFFSARFINDKEEGEKKLKEAWDGKLQQFTWWGQRKNASIFPMEVVLRKGKYFGQDVTITTGRDVSERIESDLKLRESEERLDLALIGANLGVWDWDIESDEVIINDRWANMLGYEVKEVAPQLAKRETIVHPKDRKQRREMLQSHLEGKNPYYSCEYRIRTKGGEWKWILDKGKVVAYDAHGKPTRMTGTHLDIDERKNAEKELIKLTDNLRRSNYGLQQFAYITSHNLKSPVSNLKSIFELIDKSKLEGGNKELFKHAEKSIIHLNETLDDLMKIISFSDRSNVKYEKVLFDEILQMIMASIQNQINEAGAKIMANFEKAESIFYSKSYLHSILLNLIINAIKYRSAERPCEVRLETMQKNGNVQLVITDNGLGIDLKAHGSKLFGLYTRFHDHIAGKGIGLYMVKTQVESLGGKIEVKSKPGEGTTFTLLLKNQDLTA